MRRILALTAALFGLSLACDDPTGALGPLGWGIIDGREQTATAGDEELPEPAVAQVWRDKSGQVFIGATPLYAQTEVVGVQGAVVCVGEQAIEGEPITPHARCTATDTNGLATFHLTPPTTAGTHRTPIVAEVDGEALEPDTVTAVVEAGPASVYPFRGEVHLPVYKLVFPNDTVSDGYGNEVPWALESDCACVAVEGTLESWPEPRTIQPVAEGEGTLHVLLSASDTLASGTLTVTQVPDDPAYFRGVVTFP